MSYKQISVMLIIYLQVIGTVLVNARPTICNDKSHQHDNRNVKLNTNRFKAMLLNSNRKTVIPSVQTELLHQIQLNLKNKEQKKTPKVNREADETEVPAVETVSPFSSDLTGLDLVRTMEMIQLQNQNYKKEKRSSIRRSRHSSQKSRPRYQHLNAKYLSSRLRLNNRNSYGFYFH